MRFRTLGVRSASLISAVSALVVIGYARVPSAFGGHETRTTDIQESGLDPWIVGLTIGAAVVAMVLFGIAMLVWDHLDEEAEHTSASNGH